MIVTIWREDGDFDPIAEVEIVGDFDVSYWAAAGFKIGERGPLS